MNQLRQFFYGRCGIDALNIAIIVVGLVFLFASSVTDIAPLAFGFIICLFFCIYRALSTDSKARRRENAALMDIVGIPVSFFKLRVRMVKELETHKFFKCARCGTWLRVPRGKGKISMKCSKCGVDMIRKT